MTTPVTTFDQPAASASPTFDGIVGGESGPSDGLAHDIAPVRTSDPTRLMSDRIIAAIEAGTPPWRRPWTGGCRSLPRRVTGEAYRGINLLMLWLAGAEMGCASPHWMTRLQAQALGGQVREGERAALVVKFGVVTKGREDGQGAPATGEARTDQEGARRPYLKAYDVFNGGQIDGLPARFGHEADPPRDLGTRADAELEADRKSVV